MPKNTHLYETEKNPGLVPLSTARISPPSWFREILFCSFCVSLLTNQATKRRSGGEKKNS